MRIYRSKELRRLEEMARQQWGINCGGPISTPPKAFTADILYAAWVGQRYDPFGAFDLESVLNLDKTNKLLASKPGTFRGSVRLHGRIANAKKYPGPGPFFTVTYESSTHRDLINSYDLGKDIPFIMYYITFHMVNELKDVSRYGNLLNMMATLVHMERRKRKNTL